MTKRAPKETPELATYQLNAALRALLKRFDDLCSYMKAANRDLPEKVTLFKKDYVALDRKITEESQGKFNASTACYRGYSITHGAE